MTTQTAEELKLRLDIPYADAVEQVTEALGEEGFGILTEIDVKATLKKKLDADFRPYVILGACNPPLAHRALSTELEIGLMMPCNVIVYDDNGQSVVSIADPNLMAAMSGTDGLADVAAEARKRLERVIERLQA